MKADRRRKVSSPQLQKPNAEDHQASPQVKKKKRKLQNTSIDNGSRLMDDLNQQDDETDVSQAVVHGKPEENTANDEVTFIKTMNLEEVHNHIQKCLEMSSENKITPKNAFALQLIDCMNLLLQKEDFSVMACTLDAGQKIYGYRVDGLHQQVIKLAEEVINNQKNKKDNNLGDENSDDTLKKETRKGRKKNILASSESLKRTLKSKDPKEKFIKIDGVPGAIISSVRRDPGDLSFTMQNNVKFWNDWKDYKPLTVEGTITIPHCEIYRDKNKTRKIESLLRSPIEDNPIQGNGMSDAPLESSLSFDDVIMGEMSPHEMEENDNGKSGEEELNIISTAIKRLNSEVEENKNICSLPSRNDVMKMIFSQESDYHYLNMEKASYWAGPEFWKRPKGTLSLLPSKKRGGRKKKDPNEITYNGPEAEEKRITILKKGSKLNKKTIMEWKMKKVTFPSDLKINVKQFLDLYNMSGFFEPEENSQSSEMEIISLKSDNNFENNDTFHDDVTEETSDSQDPLNSSFYENALETCSSPDERDPLNSAFYDAGLTLESSADSGKIVKVHFSGNLNLDESLVPAPKIINFQPIKYKTRPIRVDMRHLKETMWGMINENSSNNVEDEDSNGFETLEGTKFSTVLKQLPHRLEKKTAEDLSPGMALMALLTLANENNLQLKNSEDFSDVLISLEDKPT